MAAGGGGGAGPDPQKAFEGEWEALEIATHDWVMKNVEDEFPWVGLG